MSNEGTPRKGRLAVKKGSAGPAKRVEPGRRAARAAMKPTRQQLDERQERILPNRRRGPALPPGDARRSRALAASGEVPETECDESEAENR